MLTCNPYNKPTTMYSPINRVKNTKRVKKNKKSKLKKADKELRVKLSAPGVPPITCPYVDEAIRMVKELEDAYDNLRATAIAEPLYEKRSQLLTDTLEYVRAANETLRDNSLYWYKQYKNKC